MYGNLWLKRVLIPFWVIQIVFVILLVASASLGLHFLDDRKDFEAEQGEYDDQDVHGAVKIVNAVIAVYLAICCVTIIFDIVEIVLYARKRLSPVTAVVLNTIATLVWGVLLILSIVSATKVYAFGFIWNIVVFAAGLGKLIYCSVILHRFRKNRSATRGAYSNAPVQVEAGIYSSYPDTAYNPARVNNNPAGAPPDPFRDPSPAAPQRHSGTGVAAEYYGAPAYEMQQQSGGRYY